jgi:hypothetical protein
MGLFAAIKNAKRYATYEQEVLDLMQQDGGWRLWFGSKPPRQVLAHYGVNRSRLAELVRVCADNGALPFQLANELRTVMCETQYDDKAA